MIEDRAGSGTNWIITHQRPETKHENAYNDGTKNMADPPTVSGAGESRTFHLWIPSLGLRWGLASEGSRQKALLGTDPGLESIPAGTLRAECKTRIGRDDEDK